MESFDTPCVPGDEEWHRRMDAFLSDQTPWSWWWLSFVDPERPEGNRFIGLCIVPAANAVMATMIAHALGCNPGGEVGTFPAVPEGWSPRPEYVGRLISGDEARTFATLELNDWAVASSS